MNTLNEKKQLKIHKKFKFQFYVFDDKSFPSYLNITTLFLTMFFFTHFTFKVFILERLEIVIILQLFSLILHYLVFWRIWIRVRIFCSYLFKYKEIPRKSGDWKSII